MEPAHYTVKCRGQGAAWFVETREGNFAGGRSVLMGVKGMTKSVGDDLFDFVFGCVKIDF